MKKGLLNMQFWAGDRTQAMLALKVISDIQPSHTDDFDVMFSARWDCEHSPRYVQEVARKFNVFTCKTKTQAAGWPHGCNYLWLESMQHIYRGMKSGEMPRYKWILCMESDDAPLSKAWLNELHSEFSDIDMSVVGNVVPYPKHHVNGNCMFTAHPDFGEFILGIKRLPKVGWDYYLADRFRWWGWADTPLIRSIWGTKSAQTPYIEQLVADGVRMLHGVKDNSVLRWGQQNLLGRS